MPPPLSDNGAVVRVNTIWLTSDGTAAGEPCAVNVEGLPKLAQRFAAVHTLSAAVDGTAKVHTQNSEPNVVGKEFSIVFVANDETFGDTLITEVEKFFTLGTDLEIEILGSRTLTVSARPFGSYVDWRDRAGGYRRDARFNFICTARIA